jgi:hypothetical protein
MLRSARLEAALAHAIERRDVRELADELERSSGLPGPRPNLDLARAVAERLAALGRSGDPLVRDLLAGSEFLVVVAELVLALRWARGVDARGASETLETLCEDPRQHVRGGVVLALRALLSARGDAVDDLASWTDGYLQAHTVLEALADRSLLASLHSEEAVMARLLEAFELADAAPRAADRSQGLRTLRRALPAQKAAFGRRWPEGVVAWLFARSAAGHPETREVLRGAATALRGIVSAAEADRLAAALAATAPPPRDPTRIIAGTRRRGGGRRR